VIAIASSAVVEMAVGAGGGGTASSLAPSAPGRMSASSSRRPLVGLALVHLGAGLGVRGAGDRLRRLPGPPRARPRGANGAWECGPNSGTLNLSLSTEPAPVSFFQDDGLRLDADLYLPEGSEPRCSIVFCHGYGGTRREMAPGIASAFAARIPAVVLVFDYSGWGTSEGPRERLEPEREIADVRSAVSYVLATRPQDAARVGLFGLSFGGAIATCAAARDQRVKALVAIPTSASGRRLIREQREQWRWVEYLDWVEEDRRQRVLAGASAKVDPDWVSIRDAAAAAFAKKLAEADPSRGFHLDLVSAERILEMAADRDAPNVRGRPSLFIAMGRDLRTPADQCRDVAELAGGRFISVPRLGHYDLYAPDRLEWMLDTVSAFYREAFQLL
jgi:uncharacterized protein